jgi:hypothetical protein
MMDLGRWIVIFCLTCSIFTDVQAEKSESHEFVGIYNCSTKENDFQPCLAGHFPSSKAVALLSRIDSKICSTKTTKSFTYSDEMFEDVPETHVDSTTCKNPRQFDLAYLGKDVLEYRAFHWDQNVSQATINDVDSLFKKRGILQGYREFFGESLSEKPILYQPVPKSDRIYIVQYRLKFTNDPDKKYGPLFFFADGKIMEIDPEAEIRRAFILNGRFFVLLDHGCWQGCGAVYTMLFEIIGSKYEVLFKDGTWAT